MVEQVMQVAMQSGIMATLFTGLLIYVIRDTAKREKKYQEIIDELSDSLKIVKEIKESVDSLVAKKK